MFLAARHSEERSDEESLVGARAGACLNSWLCLGAMQPASAMPEIPESIGPYRILAKIGEGGMGVVYKAQDQRLQRVVSLKVIRELDSDSTSASASGRRRALLRKLRIPMPAASTTSSKTSNGRSS